VLLRGEHYISVYLLCLLLILRVRVLLVLSGDGDGFCFLFLFFFVKEAKEQIFSLSLRVDVARDGTPTNSLRFTFLREERNTETEKTLQRGECVEERMRSERDEK